MTQTENYYLIKAFILKKYGLLLPDDLKPLARSHLCMFRTKYEIECWKNFLYSENIIFGSKKLEELVDIFLVGHTSFFRHRPQFELFQNLIIPSIISDENSQSRNGIDIKIWSAGCSTGEEPYSILISLMEFFGSNYKNIKCGCLATDVSESSLSKARKGVYSNTQSDGNFKIKYSNYIQSIDEGSFEVKKFVKREAVFRSFNLNSEEFPFKGNFQVIFCRNVLMYFNSKRRSRIVKNILNHLDYNGFLFVGNSENFEYSRYGLMKIGHAVFKKVKPL